MQGFRACTTAPCVDTALPTRCWAPPLAVPHQPATGQEEPVSCVLGGCVAALDIAPRKPACRPATRRTLFRKHLAAELLQQPSPARALGLTTGEAAIQQPLSTLPPGICQGPAHLGQEPSRGLVPQSHVEPHRQPTNQQRHTAQQHEPRLTWVTSRRQGTPGGRRRPQVIGSLDPKPRCISHGAVG